MSAAAYIFHFQSFDLTATNTQTFKSANCYRSPIPDALPILINFSLRFRCFFLFGFFEINRTILRTDREKYDLSHFEWRLLNFILYFLYVFLVETDTWNNIFFVGKRDPRITKFGSLKWNEGRSRPENLIYLGTGNPFILKCVHITIC